MTTRSQAELLEYHASVLRDLSRRGHWHEGDRSEAFAQLCEVASRTLDVERVSIWLYDDERSRIVCQDLFESSLDRHSSGAILERRDYPNYFAAMDEERSIAADCAATDARTREFATSYLAPLAITSMLDAPIQTGGQSVGVVCHEHVGRQRNWTPEEETFAATIGDFAALTLEAEQRRTAEAKLRDSNLELRLALQAASLGIWVWDVECDSIRVSEEVAGIFGQAAEWRPLRSGDFVGLAHTDDRAAVRETFRRVLGEPGRLQQLQYRTSLPDGSFRWVELRGQGERGAGGKTVRVRGTVGDRTEQRELERQLFQAQKMEGIGLLAGGIAHDFNNLLLIVSGFADLLRRDTGLSGNQAESVLAISDAAARATKLTRQLLAFARQQPIEVSVVRVGAFLAGMADFLRRLLGQSIELTIDGDTDAKTRIDETQLEQVVINLCLNARDAMDGEGRLRLTVDTAVVTGSEPDPDPDLAPGRYVRIRVEDDGVGIPAELLPSVFVPFQTTKTAGGGTGLGLATCYGIVRQANGAIRVDSEEGVGTTFEVYLPRTDGPAASAAADVVERVGEPNGETVLVVDDEELVRSFLSTVLTGDGYEVLAAADAEQALQVFAANAERVRLVVADVVLPGVSGIQLAEEIRSLQPDVDVLFLSAYAQEQVTTSDDFLGKPFLPEQLTTRVRQILDRRGR